MKKQAWIIKQSF